MRRGAQVIARQLALIALLDFVVALAPPAGNSTSRSGRPQSADPQLPPKNPLNSSHFPADLRRIKESPSKLARPRRARQSDAPLDDEPAADEPLQRALLPKEGVAQAKRAARHVQRKMELLTGRVNQIQSQIAEDHPPAQTGGPSNSSSQAGYGSDFSTPYNSDAPETGDISASQYETNSDKLLDASTSAPAVASSDAQPEGQSESWSAHMVDGDEQADQRLSSQRPANESAARWSHPVIKSVVPAPQQHQDSGATGSSTERVMVDTRDPDQPVGEDSGEDPKSVSTDYQTPVASDNDLAGASNRTRLASGQVNAVDNHASSSNLGPDWAQNENHKFFQELNYKNHVKPSAESRAEEGVAFRASAQQPRHSRFQNMTVVNRDQDLLNSFSNQQHQIVASSTRQPASEQHQQQATSAAPKKTSTYSYSGYGRSAKGADPQVRSSTTVSPVALDFYDSPYSDYPTARPANRSADSQHQTSTEPPVVWPPFATSSANQAPDEPAFSGARYTPTRDADAAQNELSRPEAAEEKPGPRKYSSLINSAPAGDHQVARPSGYQSDYNYGGGGTRTHRHDSSREQLHRRLHLRDEQPSSGNSSQDNLKHRSSSGADEPMMSYAPQQDSYSPSSGSDQYAGSGSSSGGASGPAEADYPPTDPPAYQQSRPASYLSPQSSSAAGERNLFTLPADLSGAALDRALSSYGYQLANRPNQDMDSPADSRANLLPSTDAAGDSSDQQQQQSYDAQLLQALRNSNQHYLSPLARNSAGVSDSMLPSATSTNNRLLRQKQLNQMVNSLVAQSPALSSLDVGQLVQRFQEQQRQEQQQQRLLAQQQQQQQQQQVADSLTSYYSGASQRDNSPNVIYRRYSPEVNYLSRNSPSSQQQLMASLAAESAPSADLSAFSTASQFQPVYSAQGLEDNSRALRNANLAQYRASLAAAKAALSSPYHSGSGGAGGGGSGAGSANNNYSGAGQLGQLYATAAVNSPAFYDAPAGQHQRQAQHRVIAADSSQQSAGNAQYAASPSNKRSYLNSLFKPSASSRYYYAPTYLSQLSLPSGLHSIYAPSGLAGAEAMQAMPQMYAPAATSPAYLAASAMDPAQQYQAFAAANGLQAHYMDPDMAESSMVASDSAGSFADASGQTAGGSGNAAADDTNQSSSKSSKSATPWTNIAGLLLGILPFGILMASLLPAVSVAGRKKRELELSGRNFSELLKWRPPSKVLSALIALNRQQPSAEQGRAFGKTAALINEQLAQLVAPQSKRSQPQPAQNQSSPSTYSKRRSLATKSPQPDAAADRYTSSNPVYSAALNEPANATAANEVTPLESSPSPPAPASASQAQSGVKAKVRKAITLLNNFIVAAQNIKRKHRSSPVDNQWSFPAMLRNLLKLDHLFDVNEFRRQMGSIAETRQLVAEHQLQQLQKLQKQQQQLQQQRQQQQQQQQQPPEEQQPEQGAGETRAEELNQTPPEESLKTPQGPAVVSISVSPEAESPVTRTHAAVQVGANQTAGKGSLLERASELGNTTRNHLALCVNQFLCRLALRLNTVLRNSTATAIETGRLRNDTALANDHVEQLTKKYINQVVEQIEAKNVSVPLGLRSETGAPEEPLMPAEGLNVLYKNAMTNQCRAMYICSELVQFERTLAKMTNLKVGRLMGPLQSSA